MTDFHKQCEKSETGHHFHFRVLRQTGEFLDMGFYDTRIHHNTTISWVIEAIGCIIKWPVAYCSFVIGLRCFKYAPQIRYHDQTLLQDLRRECLQHKIINDADALPITLIIHPPPTNFGQHHALMCIWDFPGHGCCITGRSDDLHDLCVRHHDGCKCCGNCGICRSGNCGHACCVERLVGERVKANETWCSELIAVAIARSVIKLSIASCVWTWGSWEQLGLSWSQSRRSWADVGGSWSQLMSNTMSKCQIPSFQIMMPGPSEWFTHPGLNSSIPIFYNSITHAVYINDNVFFHMIHILLCIPRHKSKRECQIFRLPLALMNLFIHSSLFLIFFGRCLSVSSSSPPAKISNAL